MAIRPSSALVLAVVTLAGCATHSMGDYRTEACFVGFVDEARLAADLRSRQPCCETLSDVSKFATKPDSALVLHKDSPAFDFPTGRSRFVVVDLASFSSTDLHLAPALGGFTAPDSATCADMIAAGSGGLFGRRALVPLVAWLDRDSQPISVGNGSTPSLQGKGEIKSVGWRFERPIGARFAVIYSNPRDYGSVVVLDAPRHMSTIVVPTGSGMLFVPAAAGGPIRFVAVATGAFYRLSDSGPR